MTEAETRYRNLAAPEITIDEAIAICERMLPSKPHLRKVITRIKQLREQRDLLYSIANEARSDASWERSDMKKWADKQRDDPDND